MDWDQILYKWFLKWTAAKKKADPETLARQVRLEDISGRLTILAGATAGKLIRILPAEREGGWRDNLFFLPPVVSLFPTPKDNLSLYLFRVLYLATQQKLKLNWPPGTNASLAESRQKALETAPTVLARLKMEFPGIESLNQQLINHWPHGDEQLPDFSFLYGKWMVNTQSDDAGSRRHRTDIPAQTEPAQITTEMKAKHADDVEVLQVDKEAQENYVLTHNFEKVETIEQANGIWRDFDGDDNLKEDADALQDLNISKVVRADDPVHSIFKADPVFGANIPDSADIEEQGSFFSYPEWDFRKRTYREAFCKLYHKKLIKKDAEYFHHTIRHNAKVLRYLLRMFARINNTLETVRRLPQGDEIDMDAATDRYADLHAGCTPSENVYLSKRKRRKDLAMLFLLDLSLSSDGYAKGNRIIDIEKQVSILFGETLSEYGIDFAIDGFFSKTRHNTTYVTLKAFDDNWQEARLRIGAIQPRAYTRIGPALRHAANLLRQRPARKKWLILLSDGKPNDYDRYEGAYGVHDIRQALKEMQQDHINTYALAIEEEAKFYLPRMFGRNHYNILSSPAEMGTALLHLYKRIGI